MSRFKRREKVELKLTKKTALGECVRELNMRRKVWAKADPKQLSFISLKHNYYYDTLQQIHDLIEGLTPEEFDQLLTRRARKEAKERAARESQQQLF